MKILLLSSSYNSLTQRAHVELSERGHEVSIELAISNETLREGIRLFKPDLILCPMLKFIIPKDIWTEVPCIIVHPGIKGDRGSASLDWALYEELPYWGVTAVQAADEVDSGPIWATGEFALRKGSKSSIYRDDLANTAMKVMHLVVKRFENGLYEPEPLDYSRRDVKGKFRPPMPQSRRTINWQFDSADDILRKIRCSDGAPGVLDTINGNQYFLFGAHREGSMVGPPGKILAKRFGAICRATVDGAVWITHLKKKNDLYGNYFKLPAAQVLGDEIKDVPESNIDLLYAGTALTYKEIWYREHNNVAYLYFEFYNGAMSTDQCERLTQAFNEVRKRQDAKVIVLMGGRDYWSNGIHLNVIEAADDPADESWRNINAINSFVEALINTTNKYVLSAMHGSAGAGGVMMALGADQVIAREGVILNPHYKSMGGLYGSEYWTYLLPKRVGKHMAKKLTDDCLPISAERAKQIGLLDDVIYQDEHNPSSFHDQIVRIAEKKANDKHLIRYLENKADELAKDSRVKPLSEYRDEELANMRINFFGEDESYHEMRRGFVHKVKPEETPRYLATHRKEVIEKEY
ncbi:hydrogenase maturation protein [Paraneptunicella aestuarii]|uniref:hydrogenase maturation protein n=1 Tax=Paraneptunicella aestuarii TaxID=2831148 RepID=UPI001E57E5E8|nr:hydrogenase maturation protein [Paraneptunicella aestuarii]UAA38279.1 hydrogenase maturation protein [Paraneptunicella aestuarii]